MEDLINYHLKEDDTMGKIFGIQPDQIQEYILDDQKNDPPEDQVTWLFKPLDVKAQAMVSDMIYSAKGFGKKREELLKAGSQQMLILRRGFVGWKNFKYEDGSEVEWTPPEGNQTARDRIMDANLNKMPPSVRDEIADQIRGTSSLDLD